MKSLSKPRFGWFPLLLGCLHSVSGWAQTPVSDEALISALRVGGHVLVMRHAHSPREPPVAATASKDNVGLERELDEEGRTAATAMGEAWRALGIRVGKVYSSPTVRALQTARLARLPDPEPVAALGDRSGPEGRTWLRSAASEPPAQGVNTVVITHAPNVMSAFPEEGKGMKDGEILVMRPDGRGNGTSVARIPIERWPDLLAAFR